MKIYIAGPVTIGNRTLNIRAALDAAEAVLKKGHVPFIPHLFEVWDLVYPHGYDTLMMMCLEWVDACDAVYRIPGESSGADREVMRAEGRAMFIYYDINDIPEAG